MLQHGRLDLDQPRSAHKPFYVRMHALDVLLLGEGGTGLLLALQVVEYLLLQRSNPLNRSVLGEFIEGLAASIRKKALILAVLLDYTRLIQHLRLDHFCLVEFAPSLPEMLSERCLQQVAREVLVELALEFVRLERFRVLQV